MYALGYNGGNGGQFFGYGNIAMILMVISVIVTLVVFIGCAAAARRILEKKGYDKDHFSLACLFSPLLLVYAVIARPRKKHTAE